MKWVKRKWLLVVLVSVGVALLTTGLTLPLWADRWSNGHTGNMTVSILVFVGFGLAFLPSLLASRPGRGTATAGLVLGIVGFVLSFLPPLGLLASVAGVGFSALGLKSKLTRAKVGLGLSIAGIAMGIFWWVVSKVVTF